MNLVPTSTGSAKAIQVIFPELRGKLDGRAIRIPMANASITDCVFEMVRDTTVEEVNGLLKAAADDKEGSLYGILGYDSEPVYILSEYRPFIDPLYILSYTLCRPCIHIIRV